jgi:hypothetical protein
MIDSQAIDSLTTSARHSDAGDDETAIAHAGAALAL